MRVGMLVIVAGRKQRARFAQIVADRTFGRIERLVDHAAAAFLAVLVQIARAEPFPIVAITPVGHDREDRLEPIGAAQQEVVIAMVGRHMNEARAAVGGDEIARQKGTRLRVEPAEMVHRVVGNGAR